MRGRAPRTISPWPALAANRMPADSLTTHETELLDRAARGDAAAVGELYRQHQDAVRGFAQRLLGDLDTAEDLVQEVFVRLPHTLKRFRGQSSLRTFLLGVAANRCRNHVRGAARRRAAHRRVEPAVMNAAPELPDANLVRRQQAQALSRALDRLPLRLRLAFVLVAVEQRSHAEAAAVLGIPEGTVATRCFHARRKLRSLLREERP